jgi:hypothetical protein
MGDWRSMTARPAIWKPFVILLVGFAAHFVRPWMARNHQPPGSGTPTASQKMGAPRA